ncbi:helix-turn-helix domain-containing protein [Streptomyces sp. NBC_01727]|uniref:helix-turn-helix domain-containing protein n=1 Tax=Streptomyces sp. NBC_01727 TaxID=2975924 RepID=UPI002E10B532|nr:helix-turn-helix domain-containing protein [Streptomyces sp. NBC_01727]
MTCAADWSDPEVGSPATPVAAARPISPTVTEMHRLKKAVWGHKTEHRLQVRAQIVLHAARGLPNTRIAEQVGVHVDTVRTWRRRFTEQGMPGLADRKPTRRPPSFTSLKCARLRPQKACWDKAARAEKDVTSPLTRAANVTSRTRVFAGCRGLS